jgi:hypothetical protein
MIYSNTQSHAWVHTIRIYYHSHLARVVACAPVVMCMRGLAGLAASTY